MTLFSISYRIENCR